MLDIESQSLDGKGSRFYQLGLMITKHPLLILFGVLLLCTLLISNVRYLQFDTSTEGFLSKDDTSIVKYEEFRDQFGRDDFILVAIHTENIFSNEFIKALDGLHNQLEDTVPWVSEVDSLINARRIFGENDDLIVEDFFEGLGRETLNDKMLLSKKSEAKENPLYQRLIVNDNLTYTTLVITLQNSTIDDSGEFRLLKDNDFAVSIKSVTEIVKQWEAEQTEQIKQKGSVVTAYIAGSPVIVAKLTEAMQADMGKFTVTTVVIIAFFLLVMFRRLSGIFFPILVVLLSVVSTVGFMSFMSVPIQLPTVILPSFILAVAVGDSVHFLTLFYQRFDEHSELSGRKEKSEAIALALGHSGTPMLLTTLTTAAGLASFSFAEVVPIANIGIYAAVGVCFAFLLTVTLLPTLLMVLPIKRKEHHLHSSNYLLARFTELCIAFTERFPKLVVGMYLLIASIALFYASQLSFSHDPVKWLPDHWDIRQATTIADTELRGTVSIEVLLETKEENGIKDPVFLNRLDSANHEITEYKDNYFSVRKVVSVVDILKESNQALHGNQASHYSIPDSSDLVAQELFLLELSGADDLKKLIDSNYQTARVTVSIPWIDTIHYDVLLDSIEGIYKEHLGEGVKIQITGIVPILGRTLRAVITSAAISYLIAFFVISLMLILMLRSIRYGLLAMLPNIIPIVITLGLMKFMNAPLDMFSMLIASVALGLSVDDTIHFMHHFRLAYSKTHRVRKSIEHTLHSSGRAMLITSIVLCCGFLVFTFSEMNNLDNFGKFTAITIALALLADFLLAPALMILSHPKDIVKA